MLIVRFCERQMFLPLTVEHAQVLGTGMLDYAGGVEAKVARGSAN